MTLRYTQQIPELLHATRLYQRTTRKHQFYKVIGVLTIFGAAWLAVTVGVTPPMLLLLGLGIFAWFDPIPLLLVWLGYRNSVATRESYETTLDQRGTTFALGKHRTTRPWDKYRGVLESNLVFVLVFGTWAYSVIPKRALGDQAQVAELRDLLRRNITPKK
jgi:hypothetical protein